MLPPFSKQDNFLGHWLSSLFWIEGWLSIRSRGFQEIRNNVGMDWYSISLDPSLSSKLLIEFRLNAWVSCAFLNQYVCTVFHCIWQALQRWSSPNGSQWKFYQRPVSLQMKIHSIYCEGSLSKTPEPPNEKASTQLGPDDGWYKI